MKNLIFRRVDDLVGDLLYYGRKEDEELPRGAIESAIVSGDVSVCEIVDKFKRVLTEVLKDETAQNGK